MKKLWIALLTLLFIFTVQGPLTPGTVVSDAGGDEGTWLNPNNAKTENGISSTLIATGGDLSTNLLRTTNYGFTIPAGATINSITVQWKASCTVNGDADNQGAFLVVGGTEGTFGSEASALTSTLTFYGFVFSTGLPTAAQINASDFGASTQFLSHNATTNNVDVVNIAVDYTAASGHHQTRVIGMGGQTMIKEIQ